VTRLGTVKAWRIVALPGFASVPSLRQIATEQYSLCGSDPLRLAYPLAS
jgi:hypothetical protein